MRKNIIPAMLILLQSLFFSLYSINISGVEKKMDTLEYRMIGPGIQYTKFQLPEYPLSAYLLKIDMTNPYNLVETFQAGNQAGKTEAMTTAYSRLNAASHNSLAGVNGNFWIVSGQGQPTELLGVPHSGSAMGGEMITDPNNWNRGHGSIGFAMIDANKKVWIDDVTFAGKVSIPNKGEYPVSQINRIRGENELVLFNNYLGVGKTTRTDNNGTEVFIKPIDNTQWNTNQEVKCVVTRIIANQGANVLQSGESVLSGNGAAQTFLSALSSGDTLSVHMGIKTLTDNQYPSVQEMITGNALVMKNGTLTDRNTNEAYNSQLYPRTGIGTSQDGKILFLIVIDKKGTSIGASTASMCEILKAFGAVHATSMDGGGSAQMMLEGQIVNNPADGKERPVANGWFLYHKAPEDNNITKIAFDDIRSELPSLAMYKPRILAYNQYGVLIDKELENYTLTCSEGLGEITADGAFIANGSATSGTLTVTYNNASVTKNLNITSGVMCFRLDSVLIDNQLSYPIEVQSLSNAEVLSIPPALLNWQIQDNTICKIENGLLKGLSNGKTKIYGSIGTANDSLLVTVEIPDKNVMIYDDFSNSSNEWKLSASSQLSASLSSSDLPTSWTPGLAVNITYKSGRLPFIKLTNQKPLYSLADSIKIIINTGDMLIDRVLISLRANNSKLTVAKEFNSFINDGRNTEIVFALNDFFDTSDIAVFPIWLDNFNFYLKTMTENQSYALAFKEIQLIYGASDLSGIENPATEKGYHIYPNPVQKSDMQVHFNEQTDMIDYELFNISGQKIMSQHSMTVNGKVLTIPVKSLAPGYYFLTITTDRKRSTSKIIRK
ncbi:MAG: phosphodiester glycosidase family protein [Paludibacter sp.]|nr:phosphodiester glycosidase family protein [Paludibacter sp.]